MSSPSESVLSDVGPDAALEKPEYFRLTWPQLEALNDAESLFERACRFGFGIGVEENEEEEERLTLESAKLGHPLALASCFSSGNNADEDEKRAFSLWSESAQRGHPAGNSNTLK
jgi:hypothetical protein